MFCVIKKKLNAVETSLYKPELDQIHLGKAPPGWLSDERVSLMNWWL